MSEIKLIFKRFFVFTLLFIFGIVTSSSGAVNADEFAYSYEVNAPDMTDEELVEYYIENEIFPSTPPQEAEDAMFEYAVDTHLSTRFTGYTNWAVGSNETNSVSSTYLGEPVEVDENDPDIQAAKSMANVIHDYIGCGPLSMFAQFDYLSRYGGYTSFAKDPDDPYEKRLLAENIFSNVDTESYQTFTGQYILGMQQGDGTFTFPHEYLKGAENVLTDFHLAVPKVGINSEGNEYTYFDNDSQIVVYGDTVPSLKTHSGKISDIKDSIDNGMPVVWWTTSDAGDFSGHYMNIFAYETWVGTNSSGEIEEHLMFKLRINWGWSDVYMDSDLLDAVNGGFIFFEETHKKILIDPQDYGFECQYFFYEKTKDVTASIGNELFTTKRLRTGYVNHFDSTNTYVDAQYLVLSAKRTGAGTAYLEYEFDQSVEWIFFDTSWWSSSEGISIYSGEALLQYKDSQGNWVTAVDLQRDITNPYLSTLLEYPTKVQYRFQQPVTEFRFLVESDYPTGSRNKGRLMIGELNVFFTETINN